MTSAEGLEDVPTGVRDRHAALSEELTAHRFRYYVLDSPTISDGEFDVLWHELLHHLIHHRAQLVLLCRMAGGTPPGFYGPNREEMQALQSKAATVQA